MEEDAGKKILIVDDDSQILTSLSQALKHVGYEVEVACDGDEGIELIDSGYNCDLVITDITMPRVNGNAVARHIRSSDRQDTPIVAITGFGEDAIEWELFNSVLVKPFKLDVLFGTVQLLIGNR
jgi:two-component system cell cycle sensor histidine kinase/response regulator CckA